MRRRHTLEAIVAGGALGSVAAVYAGLPLALAIAGRVRPRPVRPEGDPPTSVAVVIAAYDEAADIVQKLDDLAAQEGVPGRMEVVVASDGSTDRTVELARTHPLHPTVLDLPRGGKAAALNRAIEVADGDVVVFTDANSRLGPDALRNLVGLFRDPEVGGVAGDQRYGERASGTADSERRYWTYERTLKRLESGCGSVVSSTGTLHAVRRELVDVVPGDVTDDFYLSTGAVLRGRRLVFAPDAVAWEQPNDRPRAEYRRRVRIITRGLNGVWCRRALLNPMRFGRYAGVLFVHKVARRLLFVPLAALGWACWSARTAGPVWRACWYLEAGLFGGAAVGLLAPNTRIGRLPPVALPAHFLLANVAAAHAVLNLVRSREYVVWTPERS